MIKVITLLAGALVLFTGTLLADAPELEAGVKIEGLFGPLEFSYCTIPFVVDWNNDGAKDLLVGQFTNGYIFLFLNLGTDMNPRFSSNGTLVESNGVPISASWG